MARGCLRAVLLYACVFLAACTPVTPEELMSQARAAMAAGELRTAEIHLKNLLQQQRDNAVARELLGEVLLGTGDSAGAEQNMKLALDLGADAADVDLPLLNALLAQQKFREALDWIESRSLPNDPTDTVAVALLRGAAHRGLGQAEPAVEVYRAALAAEPTDASVRTELAATLLGLGRAEEGRELVMAVLGDEPSYAPALFLRGGLETAAGERAAAEATLQQVVDLERAVAATSQRYSLAMTQLIETQVALGKLDAAAGNADAFLAANQRNPFARYAKALVEVQQNELTGAEQRLEALVAEAPEFWPAHRLLGVINLRQDQLGQAAMYLRTAVTNNPTDNTARLQLAELYIRQGDLAAARNLLQGSAVAANDSLFLAFAASASQRAGLQEQASEYFAQSEQQAPTSLQQLVDMSSLYMAAGEFERAIRVLQTSNVDDAQREQVSDYLQTLIHIRQGDLQAADALAERWQQRQPQAEWPLSTRGVIALLRGDATAARASFARVLELEPRNAGAAVNLARVAVVENDQAQAERYLRQALEIDPAHPIALVGLAQFAMARSDFPAARALLDRLPESPQRMGAEAELLAREGSFDAAAQLYAQLYSLQPSEPLALRAYDAARRAGRANPDAQLRLWQAEHPDAVATNFVLASAALERNELAEAQRLYEAVVAVNPNHTASLNNLAWLYGERNDPRAVEFGERALTAEPNNPSIADTVGWLHVQGGNAARGLPLLEQAAAALPDEREVHYHWAVALAETGDSARAVDILARLTADDRSFVSRADAERRLSDLRRAR